MVDVDESGVMDRRHVLVFVNRSKVGANRIAGELARGASPFICG